MTRRTRQAFVLTLLLFAGCANSSPHAQTSLPLPALPPPPARPIPVAIAESPPPPPDREFRGLWLASYGNLDWPSRPGLDTAHQQAELLAILDRAALLHLNTIILQVRPACDALYDSKLEPWSEALSGKMGVAPKPYYDPLAFAVTQAHQRGLELHAWFNPFRVRPRDDKTPVTKNYVTVSHSELVRATGNYQILDPGDPRSRGWSLAVIMDVLKRYDIDGVHIDDYFYPYPVKGVYKPADFPDNAPWERYLKTGGKLSRNDWRRENVNTFVQLVYNSIKKEKPWVKFGVSPFGIWRPGHPAGVSVSLDSYDALYSDSLNWLTNGWVDYLSPQLYWPVADKEHSFAALLQWWGAQNTRHRHLWPGMKMEDWPGFNADPAAETAREIDLIRRDPGASGVSLWRASSLMHPANGVAAALARLDPAPALPPASPWLGNRAPAQPLVLSHKSGHDLAIDWNSSGGEPVRQWVIQEEWGGHWKTEILPATQTNRLIVAGPSAGLPQAIAVTGVSRVGNLSPPAVFKTSPR
jgi:uncharacterized lipoprotein YddW (UPF0748 family)